MATLRELNYMIEANTDGLNKAFPALNKLVGTLHALDQSVNKLSKGIEDQFSKIGKSAGGPARQVSASADKIKAALRRQEAALISAKNKVLDLNKAIKDSGGDSRLLANNTRAFNVLEKQLKKTGASAADATLAKAKFASALATSRRELSTFNAVQRQAASTQKISDASLIKQTNTIERMRIKVLDLSNALQLQGADQSRIDQLGQSFADFEKKLESGVLSAKEFSDATNKMSADLAKVRRNEGITNLSSKMTDLAKSAQVALGPLSGVASRITAITSLANRNNLAVAGLIGSLIVFGTSMAKAVSQGARFEQQMLRIDAVLASTGGSVGMSSGEIEGAVKRVADATMATQAQVRDAAASLLTFRNVGKDIYESALLAAQGLALIARGDINSQIRNLGRVLQDPMNNLNSLTESGIVFNAIEREKIKLLQLSGDLHGAQAAVMERVNTVTDAAKGEARGLMGEWKRLTDTFNNFFRDAAVGGGTINTLTAIIRDLNERFSKLNSNTKIASGIARGYKVAADALGGALTFLATHLDKVIYLLMGFMALKVIGTIIGMAKAVWTAVAAVRALALASAIASGGITVLTAAAAGAIAYFGTEIYDALYGANEELDSMIDKLGELEKSLIGTSDSGDGYFDRFQKGIRKMREELTSGNLGTADAKINFDESNLQKAFDLFNAGKIKEAAEYVEQFTGAVNRATKAVTDYDNYLDNLTELYTNLRDNNLGFMSELDTQAAHIKNLEDNWKGYVEMLVKSGKSTQEAHAQMRLLYRQVKENGSSISQYETSLKRSIEVQRRELQINQAVGAEKRKLQLELDLLNSLYESGVISVADYQGALEDLRKVGLGPTIDAFAKLRAESERLTYLKTVQDMGKEFENNIKLMQVEVALAGKSEYERAVGLEIARQKQVMLNAGIAEGTEEYKQMLEAVRQLADLDFQKQHIESMKALHEQAKAQDRNLQTMFYSKSTRERMIALQEKENELLQKYGSLLDERAQKELQLFKTLQKRDEIVADWQEVADAIDRAFKGLEDSIVEFVKTGEFNFAKFASAILEDIFRITLRATILKPLQDWLGGLMGDMSKTPIGEAWQGGAMPQAGQFLGGVGTMANPAYVIPMGPGLGEAGAGAVGEGWGLRGTFGPDGAGAGAVGGVGGMGGAPIDRDITRSALPPVPGYGTDGFPMGQDQSGGMGALQQQADQLSTSFTTLNDNVTGAADAVVDLGNGIDMTSDAFDHKMKLMAEEAARAGEATGTAAQAQVESATSIDQMSTSSTGASTAVDQLAQAASNAAASLQGAGGIPGLSGGSGGVPGIGGGASSAAGGFLNSKSKDILNKVNADLAAVVKNAQKYMPAGETFQLAPSTIRTIEQQRAFVASGASKTMASKHLEGNAVDLNLFKDGKYSKDFADYGSMADAMKKSAAELGVPMKWGGDWKSFKDGPHFEVPKGYQARGVQPANVGTGLPQTMQAPGFKPEGLDQLTTSVEKLNGGIEDLGTSVTDVSGQLRGSLDDVTKSADDLSNQGMNKMASSMDQVDQTITGSIQSQAQAAAQTEQMGTSSTTASTQIEQLGQAAMNAAASMQSQGGVPGVPGLSGGVPGSPIGLGTGLGGGPAAFGPTGAGIADPMGMMGGMPGMGMMGGMPGMGMMGGMPGMGMGMMGGGMGMGGMPGMGMMGGGMMGGGMSSFQSFGGGMGGGGMGGMGGMGGGMGGDMMGLGQLSQSVQQANSSFMQMNEQLPEISSTLTSGLERVTDSAQELADNGLNRVSSGMERIADDAITNTVTAQAQTAATTQQLGTDSMVTTAQIQQLGQAAMQAAMQMGMGGMGGMFFHSGGIVGSNGAPAVVGGSWGGAPRLHGGLHPDEFRAVLKRGEGVFTEEQMEALGNAINNRGEAEGEGGGGGSYGQRGRSNQFQVILQGVKDYDSFKRSESQMQAGLSRAYQKAASEQG